MRSFSGAAERLWYTTCFFHSKGCALGFQGAMKAPMASRSCRGEVKLALQLVRLLDRHGVTAFWVSEEEGEKLERSWRMDACIREVQGDELLAGSGQERLKHTHWRLLTAIGLRMSFSSSL